MREIPKLSIANKNFVFLNTYMGVMILIMGLVGCAPQGRTVVTTTVQRDQNTEEVLDTTMESRVQLTMLAAASLTDVTQALAKAYKTKNPDIELIFSYGSSGTLQTQIEEGVRADLFFSAGKKQMTALTEQQLMIQESVKDLLLNRLVLIVPSTESSSVATETTTIASSDPFENLSSDKVRMIAIGDPAGVPVGQYTKATFEYLGIWNQIEKKLNYGSDVRQVLTWVETGEAEYGVVYETDALTSDKVKIAGIAPDESHDPIVYPIGVLSTSEYPIEARAFIDFLSSPEAVAIFNDYGFTMYQ